MEVYDTETGTLTQGQFQGGGFEGDVTRIWERDDDDWVHTCEYENGLIEGESSIENSKEEEFRLVYKKGEIVEIEKITVKDSA